ncbi:metabotropic glycine receptor-like isoform X2 [Antedon mediterranea]|uniref:metabotropic glycine receptor-like isoform X2 n=1 Tax=Antedon mediterranea TaxID=105859 RepID=UPI003AF9B866
MTLNVAQIFLYLEILFVHVLFHQSSSAHGPPGENDKKDVSFQRETFFSRGNPWDVSLNVVQSNRKNTAIRTGRSTLSDNTGLVRELLSIDCSTENYETKIQTSNLIIFAEDLFEIATNAALETANLINSMHKNGGQTDWPKFYQVVLGNTVEHIDKSNDINEHIGLKNNTLQVCVVSDVTACKYVSNTSSNLMELDSVYRPKFEGIGEKYEEKHMYNENRMTLYPHVVRSDGEWSEPYLDCSKSGIWIITYAVPFIFRNNSCGGIVTVDINLDGIDINQCDDVHSIFSGTHQCPEGSECIFRSNNGFKLGSYACKCNISGEHLSVNENDSVSLGCSVVYTSNRMVFRACILGLQMLCVVYVFVLIVMVRWFRRLKVLNYDSPWMIIVVLFGAILLYCELIPMYFDVPSNNLCFLQRWLREVGFAVTFGTLVLKVYRKLAIFQTRSASRVLVRDRDLIKWILVIIFVLSGYLAVWTVSTMEDTRYCNYQMVVNGSTTDGRQFKTCDVEWWDSVLGIIELVFLMFGLYLCYLVRSAPSEFNEIKYVTLAIFDEAFVSLILYIIRFLTWDEMEPDWKFLVHFLRSQLTTTVMVSIIVLPKLVLVYKLLHDDHFRERMNSRIIYDVKCQASAKRNPGNANDYAFGADEVREELRRLYTQLEIYKTNSMKENNPHIPSKKRSTGKRWRDTRKLSRGASLRTQSYHSESEVERSSDVGRSTESLSKPFENMCESSRMHSLDRGESNRRKFTLDRSDPSIVRKKINSTSSDKADCSFTNNRTCKL